MSGLVDCLDSGSAEMGDSRDVFKFVFLSRDNNDHEFGRAGLRVRDVKEVLSFFLKNSGSKRAIRFTELDFGINNVFHFRRAGIGQDAAVT